MSLNSVISLVNIEDLKSKTDGLIELYHNLSAWPVPSHFVMVLFQK